MLFFLTGDIQIGKTRWLCKLVDELAERGVPCSGVLAPGVWRDHGEGAPAGARYEKLGINNVLLPSGQLVPFARRRDLAQEEGLLRLQSQSAQAGMVWEISDAAIQQVNEHFAQLEAAGAAEAKVEPGLLVIDELGQLELRRNQGLQNAVHLLAQGPSERFPHALVIVRSRLLETAQARFEPAWGVSQAISPDSEAFAACSCLFR